MMNVGVRLLGPPAVRGEDGWMPLVPTKPHALLLYVAHRGVAVRRPELAALLWADADAVHAQADVRQALRHLGMGPAGAFLGRDRHTVWVAATTDVAGFRRAVAEGRHRDALAIRRGPLLEGFEIDDAEEFAAWLASERAAEAVAWRRVCRTLLQEATAAERHGEALQIADLMLGADPLDERAARDAMRAAAAAGDVRGALGRYHALAALLGRELGIDPEPATQMLRSSLSAVAAVDLSAIPLSAFAPRVSRRSAVVGRERATSELAALLRSDGARLVTLLGPGGIGKTTLALATLAEVRPHFPAGVFIAGLEASAGPDSVALAAARAVGVTVRPTASAVSQLVLALAGQRALLLLDGFETHMDEVETVDALIRGASDLSVLVTSRQLLRLSTEVVVPVDPLETRVLGAAELAAGSSAPSPAAQLFQRAAAYRLASPAARTLDRAAVERICHALGGHPLAIELAASWVDVLGLDGLEGQLRVSWEPLHSDDVDVSPRRRDVLAVMEEVWQNLTPDDRAAWARLAVMPGSIDRAVAAEVSGGGWRGLRRLADRALLRQRGDRIELHTLVARFGRERAEDAGLVDAAWAAAAAVWRVRIAEEVDRRSGRRIHLHPDDVEQVVGLWRWAVARVDARTLAAISYGLFRGLAKIVRHGEIGPLAQEAVTALRATLASDGAEGHEMALARVWPFAATDVDGWARNAAASLRLARRHGDDRATGAALAALIESEPTIRIDERIAEARTAFERGGDPIGLAELLDKRGMRMSFVGRHQEGEAMLGEALALYRGLGDTVSEALVHESLAVTPMLRGDFAAVRSHLASARAQFEGGGAWARDGAVLAGEVWLAILSESCEVAEARYAAYRTWIRRFGGVPVVETGLGCELRFRVGSPEEAIAQAELALQATGAPARVIPVGALANQLLAVGHARLGRIEPADAALAEGLRMARALESPRFMAHSALTAAEVADVRGERELARRFLAAAWHHPGLAYGLRRDARALAERWGEAWPPPCPARPGDDAAVAEEIEAFLARG